MWGENIAGWAYNFCGYGPSFEQGSWFSWWPFGHGPWFFGWLFPLLFWGVIILIVYTFAKSLFGGGKGRQEDNALEILRNRFASGEISEKEYIAQKNILDKR